jgi:hypothetical protein
MHREGRNTYIILVKKYLGKQPRKKGRIIALRCVLNCKDEVNDGTGSELCPRRTLVIPSQYY